MRFSEDVVVCMKGEHLLGWSWYRGDKPLGRTNESVKCVEGERARA